MSTLDSQTKNIEQLQYENDSKIAYQIMKKLQVYRRLMQGNVIETEKVKKQLIDLGVVFGENVTVEQVDKAIDEVKPFASKGRLLVEQEEKQAETFVLLSSHGEALNQNTDMMGHHTQALNNHAEKIERSLGG